MKLCLDIDDFPRQEFLKRHFGGQRCSCYCGTEDVSTGDLQGVLVHILTVAVKGLTFHTVGIFFEKYIC